MRKMLLQCVAPKKLWGLLFFITATLGNYSCTEQLAVTDNSFELSGKVVANGNIYVNAEIPVELKMVGDVIKKTEVDVIFVSSNIPGTLYNSSKVEIKPEVAFKHKFETPLNLIFKPSSAKDLGTLIFKVNEKEVKIDIQVNNPSHGLVFTKAADTITVGRNAPLQFTVAENSEAIAAMASKAGGNTYTLSATLVEGKGVLVVNEKVLINNTAQLVSPMGGPATSETVSKASKAEVGLSKEEITNAVFVPYEKGKHTIKFNLTDSYGNTISQDQTMQAEAAPLSLKFTATRDKAEVGQTLLYDLLLAMDGYTGGFRIHSTVLAGSGVLKLDGTSVSLTTPFTVAKAGVKKVIFEPVQKSGSIEIAFIAYDDFGGFAVDTLRGVIEDNTFQVTTTLPTSTTVKYQETIPIVIGISQEAATAQYTYIVESNVDGIILKKENTVVKLGQSTVITSGLHNFVFTGSACGDVVLTFKVKQANQEKTVELNVPIKVSAFPLSVNLLNQSATTTRLNVPVTFDLQFETEKAPADNDYFITPSVKGSLGVIGTFGSPIHPENGVYKTTKGTHQFTYTPMGLGEHTVEFEVYDGPAFGQRKTVSALVKVVHAEIVVTPSTTTLNTHINENKGFTINVSEEDYTGGFKLAYTGGTGELKTSTGQTIAANTPTVIANGTTILSYTPKAIGTETLEFTVTDDNNQSKEFNIDVTATHVPMTFTASIAGSGYNGRSYSVPLSFSGAGPYKVNYTITGAGTVERNNSQPVAPNAVVSVSDSEQWHFKPVGNSTLSFTAIDKNGQSKSASATIQSRVATVSASMSSPTSSVVKKNNVTSYLRVSNEAGDNTYRLDVSGAYNGTLNITSGTNYTTSSGQIGLTFNPNTLGPHTITIKATDNFEQSATTTWTVNSVAAEINASMSGGAANYLGFAQSVTVNVSKPDYSSGYTVNLSSNNSGTLSHTRFENVGVGGSGSVNFNYTPSAVGGHTLTATITDNEGKSKSVAVVLTCNMPRIGITITPRLQSNGQPYALQSSDVSVGPQSDYPNSNPFTISIGTWQYNTPSMYHATAEVTATNMWGHKETKSVTVSYDAPTGGGDGGGLPDQGKPPVTDR